MPKQTLLNQQQVDVFCDDPFNLANCSQDELFSLEQSQVDQIQLAGLRKRFTELMPQLSPLERLANENCIADFSEINDVVPLLFPHTMYKSYPVSLIDNCRFEHLNTWLNEYTTYDLSGLDLSNCQSLDDWFNVIETNTPVKIVVSSGTSGKISILPRSKTEAKYAKAAFTTWYGKFGDESAGIKDPFAPHVYFFFPFPRHGRHNTQYSTNFVIDYGFNGDESHVLSLKSTMSTDVLWMTGRLKKAELDGTLEKLKKTKAWQRLSGKLTELADKQSDELEALYQTLLTQYKGKTILFMAGMNYYLGLVNYAEQQGLEIDFAPDSVMFCGGGKKRNNIGEADLQRIQQAIPHEFLDTYGCGEMISGAARVCPAGHFHTKPHQVNFVLNPETGEPYPRKGVVTGRYAGFDLWLNSSWGGLITGDEVTINWDGGCSCGRKGAYMHQEINRYSEKQGGDDKITCQRTAAAVEEMMEHMKSSQ